MESNLITLALCMILAFLLGVASAILSGLAFEEVSVSIRRWWRGRHKGPCSTDATCQLVTDYSFLSPVKPFVGYWEIRYLKNGAFRLVQLDTDDWIDYNPKAQWAEECNQNCGCQLVKGVKP